MHWINWKKLKPVSVLRTHDLLHYPSSREPLSCNAPEQNLMLRLRWHCFGIEPTTQHRLQSAMASPLSSLGNHDLQSCFLDQTIAGDDGFLRNNRYRSINFRRILRIFTVSLTPPINVETSVSVQNMGSNLTHMHHRAKTDRGKSPEVMPELFRFEIPHPAPLGCPRFFQTRALVGLRPSGLGVGT